MREINRIDALLQNLGETWESWDDGEPEDCLALHGN